MTKHVKPAPKLRKKQPTLRDEQVVAIVVSGSGDSYKKAVNHALESAPTAYKKQMYGNDYDYEDWSNDEVKYELSIIKHTVTFEHNLYSHNTEPTHYITATGTATVAARVV